MVIRYAYLWSNERDRGQIEGTKDRPAAIILTAIQAASTIVLVVPITHTMPGTGDGIEIPIATKARLGLDNARSWAVVSEANVFIWPGPDLRTAPGTSPESPLFGFLPPDLYRDIRDRVVANNATGRITKVRREE